MVIFVFLNFFPHPFACAKISTFWDNFCWLVVADTHVLDFPPEKPFPSVIFNKNQKGASKTKTPASLDFQQWIQKEDLGFSFRTLQRIVCAAKFVANFTQTLTPLVAYAATGHSCLGVGGKRSCGASQVPPQRNMMVPLPQKKKELGFLELQLDLSLEMCNLKNEGLGYDIAGYQGGAANQETKDSKITFICNDNMDCLWFRTPFRNFRGCRFFVAQNTAVSEKIHCLLSILRDEKNTIVRETHASMTETSVRGLNVVVRDYLWFVIVRGTNSWITCDIPPSHQRKKKTHHPKRANLSPNQETLLGKIKKR